MLAISTQNTRETEQNRPSDGTLRIPDDEYSAISIFSYLEISAFLV